MFPQKSKISAEAVPKNLPFRRAERTRSGKERARGYGFCGAEPLLRSSSNSAAMLAEMDNENSTLTARRLMTLTEIRSLSTIRRGLEGLMAKLSIERNEKTNGNGGRDSGAAYRVYPPEEVIERRKVRGFSFANGIEMRQMNHSFSASHRVAENRNLSRRRRKWRFVAWKTDQRADW